MMRLATLACVAALGACNPSSGAAGSAAEIDAPASAAAQAGMRSEQREFRDWWAVCDNGNNCFAYGFAPDFDAGWVRIHMPAGPDAEPSIAFGLWTEDFYPGRNTNAPVPPVALEIDGRNFPGTISEAASEDVAAGDIRQGARAAISAMAAGRVMQIRAGDTKTISLAGASAALLWIDERQGRLNTSTALLRRGDRPASGVPTAPALPVIRAAAAADQTGFGDDKQTLPETLRALPAVRDCLADSEDNSWLRENVMSARLDGRTELWAVPCGSGAYNVSHYWYISGPGGADPRPADLLGSQGPREGDQADDWPTNATINGGYASDTRTISAFSKGRGLGDCGTAQTWAWTGRRFELTEESAMDHCAGVPFEYWPSTWRSR